MTRSVRMTRALDREPHARTRPGIFGLSSFVFLFLLMATFGHAAEMLRVTEGKSIVLRYPEKVETVSLADEEVADVVAITPDELVIIGKAVGTTSLIVWGISQHHTAYEVKVDRNFSGRQVILEVQVAEVNMTKLSELGFDFTWESTDPDVIAEGTKTAGSFGGKTQGPQIPLTPQEGVAGFFKFVGTKNKMSAAISALQEQGDLKMLATPRLLSLSGEEGSFLSGGEFPVPVPQSGTGGAATYTIEWKRYGVSLDFVPTVVDSDLINLNLTPEVSSLDWANSVGVGGFQIPALLTRRANTTVELNSGETLFLAGLVAKEEVKTLRRVPILGHIPLLGALFTRKDTSAKDNELVFIVSPRIIGPAPQEVVPPLPWDGTFESEKSDTTRTGEMDTMNAPGGADR